MKKWRPQDSQAIKIINNNAVDIRHTDTQGSVKNRPYNCNARTDIQMKLAL
jgi:hypothetical protein